jgi:t-SNARE complex subunit (syntaxin)
MSGTTGKRSEERSWLIYIIYVIVVVVVVVVVVKRSKPIRENKDA